MTTGKTFTAARPATVKLYLPAGTASVKVDPDTDRVTVTINTADDSGPSADAVNGTTDETGDTTYTVRVPDPEGVQENTVTDSMIVVNNAAGGSTGHGQGITVHQRIGVIEPGAEVTLIHVGGVAPAPAPRTSYASTPRTTNIAVHADVTLPLDTGIEVRGISVNVRTAGRLKTLGLKAVSGAVMADSVANARVKATAVNVRINEVQESLNVKTVSGAVTIDNYQGNACTVKTTSAPITIAVTGQASGRLKLNSLSGDVTVTGAAVLDGVDAKTSGHTKISNG